MSPLLFVIIMVYLNIFLNKMQKDPNFNHHTKYEKLSLTNLAFADDVLMFSRGDLAFVELMVKALKVFSMSNGHIINPSKCRVYFGGVGDITKHAIKRMTTFIEGHVPFKYFGVLFTSKKLSILHYMVLVDNFFCKNQTLEHQNVDLCWEGSTS